MTIIIAVVGQKGGSAKSSCARALAVHYAKGRKKVRVLDYDSGQSTTGKWALGRKKNGAKPEIDCQTVDANSQGFDIETHAPGLDYLIIDAPGWSDAHTKLLAQQSDFVIVPCGASMDEIIPTVQLIYDFDASPEIDVSRAVVVLTRIDTDAESKFARSKLKDAGVAVLEHEMRTSPLIKKAQNVGLSALETSNASVSDAAKALTKDLADAIKRAGKSNQSHMPAVYEYQPGDEVL